mgnify:FL=1
MGTWLVEDIENELSKPGNVAMWWLGCTESGLKHREELISQLIYGAETVREPMETER